MPKSPTYHPPAVDSTSPSTDPVDPSPPVVADSQSSATDTVKSPDQWAEAYFPASDKGRFHDDMWKHGAATQLHAWTAYTARTGKPVALSESAYKAALAAVSGNELKPAAEADYRNRS